jgi:hypothetical protein
MSRFADEDTIPIHADDEPRDVIYIYPTVTLGLQRRINNRYMAMQREMGVSGKVVVNIKPAEYNFAILCEMIARWEGPGFKGRKFSEHMLDKIGADDEFITKVLKEIKQRNPRFQDDDDDDDEEESAPTEEPEPEPEPEVQPDPNSLIPARNDGNGSLQVGEVYGRENGMTASPTQRGITGPLTG